MKSKKYQIQKFQANVKFSSSSNSKLSESFFCSRWWTRLRNNFLIFLSFLRWTFLVSAAAKSRRVAFMFFKIYIKSRKNKTKLSWHFHSPSKLCFRLLIVCTGRSASFLWVSLNPSSKWEIMVKNRNASESNKTKLFFPHERNEMWRIEVKKETAKYLFFQNC